MKEQTKLLAPDLVTVVKDDQGVHVYKGPQGYFDSLGDWSKSFSTRDDFRFEYRGTVNKQYIAAIHGSIVIKKDGQEKVIQEGQHCWNEIFNLSADGKITRLEVDMNLSCE